VVWCGEFCVDGSSDSLYNMVLDGIQPDCTSMLVGDMRCSKAGARSATVLLAQCGASCMCFDSQQAVRVVSCSYVVIIKVAECINFRISRIVSHKGDSKLASTSSITPSIVMPSSSRPTALGSLPHCKLFSVLEVARTSR